MTISFGYTHPRSIHVTAQDSIQNLAHFTIQAMRLSTHNRLGVRLVDTFLLALFIDPEVLLGEIVFTKVRTTTFAMWYTFPTTQQIPSVALASFHTGQGAITMGLWVTAGSRAARTTDLIMAVH